ncbi:MAG: hypothetical protein Q8O72_07035 [Bacteroidales bacterium]|nr:hypothetical protein [Bacteroidales bacterium]
MKKEIIIISFIISLLVLNSCREISVTTVINKDGSFLRTIKITGDSSAVFNATLPYPVDETWKMEFLKDTTGSENDVLIYTKLFKTGEQLSEELSRDTSWWKHVKRTISIEKKSGFFYSYLEYNETIYAANPFDSIDFKNYLSQDDLLWLSGKKLALNSSDSAKIKQAEDTAEVYLQYALTVEIVAALKQGIEQLNRPELDPALVDLYKDSIAEKVNRWDLDSTLEFVDYLARLANNSNLELIKESNPAPFHKLDNKIKVLFDILQLEDFNVLVELPGLITETNSLSPVGNRVSWNVNNMSFLFEKIQMTAESRVVNVWMFVIGGIILLSFIFLTVIKSRK